MGSRRRKVIFRSIVVTVLIFLALVVALPLWFPWMLRPVGKHFGLSYTLYERDGYGGFRLKQLKVVTPSGILQAKETRGFLPSAWGWKLIAGESNVTFLQVDSWEFIGKSRSNRTVSSVYTNVVTVQKTLEYLRCFLPRAELTNGILRLDQIVVGIPDAKWVGGKLTAALQLPRNITTDLQVEYRAKKVTSVSLSSVSNLTRSEFWVTNGTSELRIAGTASWWSNRLEIAASFPRHGVLPETASVSAGNFQIPGKALQLEDYRNLTGSFQANWKTNGFKLDLNATASPLSPNLSAIAIEAHASGDTNVAHIDQAKITLPWLNAELSEGTTFEFTPPYMTHPAHLKVSADLSKQSRFPAKGDLGGTATLLPNEGKYPRIDFLVTGSQVAVSNLQTRALRLEGQFDFPQLTIASANVVLGDGSEATLRGGLNLTNRTFGESTIRVVGTFGQPFLPPGYTFTNAELQAQFSGPFPEFTHSGSVAVKEFRAPNLNPMRIILNWSGQGTDIQKASVEATSGSASVNLMGAFKGANDFDKVKELQISELSLRSGNEEQLKLEQPFTVTFQKSRTESDSTNDWKLEIPPIRLNGPERTLSIAGKAVWPARGEFQVTAKNLGSGLFGEFISQTNAEVILNRVALNGSWTNGPVTFALESSAELKTSLGYAFSANAQLNGGVDGISITELSITSSTQVVCHAEGFLPFVLHPSGTNGFAQVNEHGRLQLRAFTQTNSAFWTELERKSPLRLSNPQVSVNVTGTWAKPQGQVDAMADRVEFQSAKALPTLENLNFSLNMDREGTTSHLRALIQNQPVSASAEIPLGTRFWKGLGEKNWVPDLRQARGAVTVQNAQITPFVPFLPNVLSPQGEISLNLKLEPEYKVSGTVILYNAATPPLPSLGPIRSIDAKIVFAGSDLILTNMAAEIGGQRIAASGGARIDESTWRDRKLPAFEVRLQGTNVPLVRQAGILVRADLNLSVTNSPSTGGKITGTVHLRDSLLLSSLKDLAPGKVASVKRRPPYFSIEAEPWADWKLGVQVDGEKFLKVQSPIFRGTASTTLRLEGTLKEPFALGEARIDSGFVSFPFGSLTVQQGFISLTSDNLYHPQMLVNASAQRMGYDIKLEITGPADQPILQFSSSPPLTSEQILLMLTTGQAPQGIAASSTRQRAQGMAMFVGKNMLSDIGIGGDEERLTVRSGEQLTEAGRPTYDVEYKFNDDWALIGEYDRFSQYNLSLKWRIYSK